MVKEYITEQLKTAGVAPDKMRKSSKDNGLFVYYSFADLEGFRTYFIPEDCQAEELEDTIDLIKGES